jgi:hypothetical protein
MELLSSPKQKNTQRRRQHADEPNDSDGPRKLNLGAKHSEKVFLHDSSHATRGACNTSSKSSPLGKPVSDTPET